MAIGGLFHDRDDADRFVWMRGLVDGVAARRPGCVLRGPVWKQHGPAANRRWSTATTCCCCGRRTRHPAPGPAARRSGPRDAVPSGWSSPRGCTSPVAAPARGSRSPSSRCWPRLSGRRSPPGAPSPPRTPSPHSRSAPTTRSSGRPPSPTHASYVAALTALDRDPAWLRTMSRPRRPRCPRRDPPPPPHRPLVPPARGIVPHEMVWGGGT